MRSYAERVSSILDEMVDIINASRPLINYYYLYADELEDNHAIYM